MQQWPHTSQTDPEYSGGGGGSLESGVPSLPSSQPPSPPIWRSRSAAPPGSDLPPSASGLQPQAEGPRPPSGAAWSSSHDPADTPQTSGRSTRAPPPGPGRTMCDPVQRSAPH
eukprot:2503539-Rhodomonas_salina.5